MSRVKRIGAATKEGFRKQLVALKKRPQKIAFVTLLIAFLVYSLNLTCISNTTNRGMTPMGLCEFVSMLLSILVMVVYLNAFPKRKKPRISMLIILGIIIALILVADIEYLICIEKLLNRGTATEGLAVAYESKTVVINHVVWVGIAALAFALLPVYSKLLRKINTSIDVDGNEDLHVVDVADGDDE